MNAGRRGRHVALALATWVALICLAGQAQSQTCSATVTDVAFGSIDTLAGAAVDTTATVDISCSGIGLTGVRVCPYLGDGTGGRDATARYMQGASAPLAYQLYTDAARTTVWGSATLGFGSYPTVDFTGNLLGTATGNATLTIYGRVLAGQSPVPPDTYLSNFTAAHTEFQYGINLLGLISCDNAQILGGTVTPVFAVTAVVDKNCLVSTTDVDFGTHGVLATAVAAVGAVTVECTPDTTYTVALDNGVTGTGPTARLMTASGASITYGLYQDAAHTEPWGQSGAGLVAGTGSGADQVHDVYGLVPAQATPAPGVYQDTVVVTVAY